jgi:hypothetical protein
MHATLRQDLTKPFILRPFSHIFVLARVQTFELPTPPKPFENRFSPWISTTADVRILLTDKAIARLPTPEEGWYLARDTELKGFFVVIGKRKRTFTVQGDLRQGGSGRRQSG